MGGERGERQKIRKKERWWLGNPRTHKGWSRVLPLPRLCSDPKDVLISLWSSLSNWGGKFGLGTFSFVPMVKVQWPYILSLVSIL